MKKKNDSKRLPGHEHIPGLDDYDLPPHLELDYRKAKPNRFAGRVKFTYGGARRGAGRKPAPEPIERHTVSLRKSDAAFLRSVDKQLSAAIRKLIAMQRDAKKKRA